MPVQGSDTVLASVLCCRPCVLKTQALISLDLIVIAVANRQKNYSMAPRPGQSSPAPFAPPCPSA